jgi:hypothetical protein
MLREIEQYTGQRIEPVKAPSKTDVAARRAALFKERILKTLEEEELELYLNLVEELAEESGSDMAEIAAAAARLARGDKPLEVVVEPLPEQPLLTEEGMVRLFLDAGAVAECAQATSSGRSLTRLASRAMPSVRSTSMTPSVLWMCPSTAAGAGGHAPGDHPQPGGAHPPGDSPRAQAQAEQGRSKYKGKKIYPKSGKKFHRH